MASIAAAAVSAAICKAHGHLYLWGADPLLNPWVQRNGVPSLAPQGATSESGGGAGAAAGLGAVAMTPRSSGQPVIHR
jgi:hypothetical protein